MYRISAYECPTIELTRLPAAITEVDVLVDIGFRDAALLLLSLDNVRLLGLDGLILAVSLAVVVMTWRTVRSVPPAVAIGAGNELTATQAGSVPPLGLGLARRGALPAPGPSVALGLLIVGVLIVWSGVRLLAEPDAVRMGVFFTVLGAGLFAWLDAHANRAGADTAGYSRERPEPQGQGGFWGVVLPRAGGSVRWLLAGVPVVATLLVWRMMRSRELTESHNDIAWLWIVAIVSAFVAVAWPLSWPDALSWSRVRGAWGWLIVVGAIAVLSGVLRLWNAGGYPRVFNGDEGTFALSARQVLDGGVTNPFGTGIQAHPNLFFYLQAASMWLFGEDAAGIRVLSGLLGVVAVIAAMMFSQRMFGWLEAVVVGTLLATFHHHIFVSRTAMNNVGDTLFLPLALWLVDRGIFGRRRLESLVAGFAIGGAQYFYVGSRLLPVIVAAFVGAALLFNWRGKPAALPDRVREILPYAVLMGIGALIVVAPFLAYYLDYPELANARVRTVSIFQSGWLDGEIERTGDSATSIIARRIWDCLLLPFHGDVQGYYRPEAPYVGVVLAVPVALGLAVVVAGFWKRRYLGLAIAYVAAAASLALTEGAVYQSNRYSGAIAITVLLAAIGFGSLVRIMTRLGRINDQMVLATVAVAVGLIGAWNVDFFFRSDNQIELYSDHNTQVANTLAYELAEMEPGVTVYFAGPPRMWYDGFANIEFIAPEATGISLEEPLSAASPLPEITGTTLFVFLPERVGELETVRSWFPGGVLREVHGDDGMLLYYEYRVEPAAAAYSNTAPFPALETSLV